MTAELPNRGRLTGERGQIGGIEVLPFGFLVFVSGMLIVANAWGVVDAKLAVTAAAREGVRAYVESADAESATTAALASAEDTLRAFGRDRDRAKIEPPVVSGGFSRCARVIMTVTYDIPVIEVPFVGGFGDLEPVSSTFTEIIDPFRDGLDGPAAC